MYKTKKISSKIVSSLGILLMLATSIPSSFAHAPEDNKTDNLCNDDHYQYWEDDSDYCDPNNPLDLTDGINNERDENGVNDGNYPFGLCYPSFNNYTDSSYIDDTDDNKEKGWDPLDTYPPLFKDERDFFKARVEDETPSTLDYTNSVTVENGDTVKFAFYIHNNGDSCYNNDITSNSQYKKDWNTTSENTMTRIEALSSTAFYMDEDGLPAYDLTKATTFTANIWSDNAIDASGEKTTQKDPTYDGLTITPEGENTLKLKYVEDSASYIDYKSTWEDYELHPIEGDIQEFFEFGGMPLSTLDGGAIKTEEGDYFACQPYIGIIVFTFEVEEEIPPQENICQDLKVTVEKVSGEDEEPKYKLTPDVTFTVEDPENTQIKWTLKPVNSMDLVPDGRLVSEDQASNETITTNINDEVYFEGYGAILTAEVVPSDLDPYNDCVFTMTFEPKDEEVPEDMVCKNIEVVMPTANGEKTEAQFLPIYENSTIPLITYTTYEGDNTPDPSYVIYYVQPGHGSIKPAPGVTPLLPPVIPTPNYILVVKSGDMVIFTAGNAGTDVLKISEGSTSPVPEDCTKTYDVIPLPDTPDEPVCEEIILEQVPEGDIYEDSVTEFTAYSLNSDGEEFDGDITYSVDTGHGYFSVETPTGPAFLLKPVEDDSLLKYLQQKIEKAVGPINLTSPLLDKNFPWAASSKIKNTAYAATVYNTITVAPGETVYFYATDAGENVIHITTEGTDVEDCELNLDILEKITPPEEEICIELEVTDYLTGTLLHELEPLDAGAIYIVESTATYDPAQEGSSVYSGTQGVFMAVPEDIEASLASPALSTIVKQTLIEKVIKDLVPEDIAYENYDNYDFLLEEIEVEDGTPVIFITFADAESGPAFAVQAKDREEEACADEFVIEVEPTPPPEEEVECLDLEIVQPESPWTEDDFTGDDEQRFKIDVETNPANMENELAYVWKVSPSYSGEFDKDITMLGSDMTNPLINYLREIIISDEPEVTVYAQGWENVCSDSIKLHEDDEEKDYPDIEKYIFNTDEDEWDNIINLGGKDEDGDWLSSKYQYVTYLAVFEPGSSTSAEIWEEEINNGVIEAANTKDGEFEYLGMVIAATVKNGDTDDPDDGYVLFKSDDFKDNKYEDDEVVDLENFENFDEDMDFFEDNFECNENNEGELCIDNDFDDLDDIFADGGKIEFENTNTVEQIYIVYQMENNTEITDDYCETMIEEYGECGEEFENEIKFKAHFDDGEVDTGDDDALAIVICPYILTREGGDVFYNSALDTGVDVSACYDVKSTPGVIIKPKPDNPETPKTGQGEEELTLSAPTHDVCKLSNTENLENPEQYQDILKNFSSSVCEMEAEVSEIWTETYITNAIRANIEKIARFTTIKSSKNVTSMLSIAQQLGDKENGVFVIEGDLTIGTGTRSDFMVAPYSNIPAAQTYIVKNGTLKIESNIKYDDSNVNIVNPKTIPSVAFIVIDGNIEIDNNVSQIDGVLMAVDTDNSDDGQVKASPDEPTYEETLTIKGNLIGNVYNLFVNRRAIGDPLKDEGSVTVRYDERILLNTPPGLNELIDVNQLKTAL